MPPVFELTKTMVEGEVVVSFGSKAVFVMDPADRGMRNLAVVALTRAGVKGVEVAELFEIRPEHVSRLRRIATQSGSAGLVAPMGRPARLDEAGVARAYAMADEGRRGIEIATALAVSQATISRCLARRPAASHPRLDLDDVEGGGDVDQDEVDEVDEAGPAPMVSTCVEDRSCDRLAGGEQAQRVGLGPRIAEGEYDSAYAGAMLLHAFLDKAGANEVLGALESEAGRHYGSVEAILATTFGFALGISSLEGAKHLLHGDAGPLVGLERFPHLRSLRPRLAALADIVDPLALQVGLAAAMLDADTQAPEVFFVDDHFVAYTGAAPVAKGWNTRRRLAEAGHDDTLIVDDRWRAICFSSGPPSSLSATMFGPLAGLRTITNGARVMIGFDRGGSFPKVFARLVEEGFDWVSYRRAPLAIPTRPPAASWVSIEGHRHYISVADEPIELNGYGPARQISVYEGDRVALQILTSKTDAPAARLAHVLRCRWCIENTFKYLEAHQGMHWMADYHMERTPDPGLVKNPARVQAKLALNAALSEVGELERLIGTTTTSVNSTNLVEVNATLVVLGDNLATARSAATQAKAALAPIPAKIAATTLRPDAERAWPRTCRRSLQMVCRLLAYNAELDLARSLNTYLADPNEYRAITRNLFHQPGRISFSPSAITVSLRAPDSPRIAKALSGLIDQINTNPPRFASDSRPITYQIEPKP